MFGFLKKIRAFFSSELVVIVFLTLFAALLRFYKLSDIVVFNSEQGHNYLAIKNIVKTGKLPLLGPPTSHPWLSFGPIFYYLLLPIMLLTKFNPIAPTYIFTLIYTLIVPLNYFVIKKLFNSKTALLSSFFITLSPIWLHFSRAARFFCLVPPLFYLYILLLSNYLKNGKKIFLLGLLLGIILNFHLTALILIPSTITTLFFAGKNKRAKSSFLKWIAGLFLPFTTLFIHDLGNGLQMTKNFLLWIPYRIAGFSHLYPKNNLTLESFKQTISGFYQFIHLSFFPKTFPWQFGLSILLIISFLMLKVKKYKPKPVEIFFYHLGFWGIAALFVHTNPPLHYFLPLLSLPPIILSSFLTKKTYPFRSAIIIIALFFSIFNFGYFFSENWFYLPKNKVILKPHYIPYHLQVKIMKYIIKDSQGQSYSLSRIGPHDDFENSFADNYYYLGWYLGNQPKKEKQKLNYIIIEDLTKIPLKNKTNQKLIKFNSLTILKTEN